MSEINQVKNTIQEEFKKVNPYPKRIISSLFNLRIDKEGLEFAPKDEWRYIPQAEFFNIIGEIFNRNPVYYMRNLYKGIKKKMRKLNGRDKLKEFEKYILETYCLYPEEQILFEFDGLIQFFENPSLKSRGVSSLGTLYLTPHRIIVCPLRGKGILPIQGTATTGLSSRRRIINLSLKEKCYGYIFPIKNLSNLKKRGIGNKIISYNVDASGGIHKFKKIKIIVSKTPEREEILNKLFEILSEHSKEEVRYSV